MGSTSPGSNAGSRRDFLKSSTAVAGAVVASHVLAPQVHAAGNETLRVGLIGCGGRGKGAAKQALLADPNVKLVAMGDAFADRLEEALGKLNSQPALKGKIDVPADRRFSGLDAYKKVIASGVDVVILTTPPHFRPVQLAAAIDAGKHVFCEKPIAVDVPGAKSVLETCELARKKKLSLVSGLCYRYQTSKREVMKQVHAGAVGEIIALHTNYNTGFLWSFAKDKAWSDMEWQIRNWLYFTWLSGDHIVEQHIHSLDKMLWAMKDAHPIKANGLGGRQVRTGDRFGNIFDHHSVVYEFDNGVRLFANTRQQDGCKKDINDYVMGTKGTADVMRHRITGETNWRAPRGSVDDMYQNEHNELFASIRKGEPINNGDYMVNSTLVAIMGRMATYTGQEITWDMLMGSKEDLTPASYEFGPIAIPPVATPGKTAFS